MTANITLAPVTVEQIGAVAAYVAVPGAIVGVYCAPLPKPLGTEMIFAGTGGCGGRAVSARVALRTRPLAGIYLIFPSDDDVACVIDRVADLGLPPLITLLRSIIPDSAIGEVTP